MTIKRQDRAVSWLAPLIGRGASYIGVASVLGMMFYVVASILAREFAGAPLPAVTEIVARWLLVPAVVFGWLVAQLRHEQIAVRALYNRLSDRLRIGVGLTNYVIVCTLMLLMAWYSWESAMANRARGEFGIDSGWPVWVTRFFVPLACLLFALVTVVQGRRLLASRRGGTVTSAAPVMDHRIASRKQAGARDAR